MGASAESEGGVDLSEVVSAELAELAGVVHAAHGAMVRVMAEALVSGVWQGDRVLSPQHFLTWQTSLSDQAAAAVVRLAQRADELVATVEALCAGRLSLASAGLIARFVPVEFEADVLVAAEVMTVNQLRRSVSKYCFDADRPKPEPAAPVPGSDPTSDDTAGASGGADGAGGGGAGDDGGGGSGVGGDGDGVAGTDDGAAGGGDGPAGGHGPGGDGGGAGPAGSAGGAGWRPLVVERREVSCGVDDEGGWLSARLPADEWAVVTAALQATRDDLYRQACAGLAKDAPRPKVSLADALVAMAEGALAGGQARMPGTDRYLVHTHLAGSPLGGNQLSLHLGAVLPEHLRHLYSCDGNVRPVLERDGVPCRVGRKQRIVPRWLRRLVEHRDGGCATPGCGRRFGLEVHHIVHWEHGGPTVTGNLVTLCRAHHRAHHLGELHIWGDADAGLHVEGGVRFANRFGRILAPVGAATALRPGETPAEAADRVGLARDRFDHALGERLDPSAVHFNPTRPSAPRPPGDRPAGSGPPPAGDPARTPTGGAAPSPPAPNPRPVGPVTTVGSVGSVRPAPPPSPPSPRPAPVRPAVDPEVAAMRQFRADVLEQWKQADALRHLHDEVGITRPDPDHPTIWRLVADGGTYEDRLDQLVEQTAAELRAAGFTPPTCTAIPGQVPV